MQLSVGAAPVQLDLSSVPDVRETGLVLILQNLGPDDAYFDLFDPGVTPATGVKISAGGAYELPRASARPVYLVSAGSSDVRWTAVD